MIDGFAMQEMNDLLADCDSDLLGMAEDCLRRIAGEVEFDPVMQPQYELVLSVLIYHEWRTADRPNFYNIWALIAGDDLDEELRDDTLWNKLWTTLQPGIVHKVLVDLGLWLQPFQFMRPASAA
jgi:hypothetical protein